MTRGMPMARRLWFGQDLFIPRGGCPDRSSASASDFPLDSGVTLAGDGVSGGSTGTRTTCGFMTVLISPAALHSLTAEAITEQSAAAQDSGAKGNSEADRNSEAAQAA